MTRDTALHAVRGRSPRVGYGAGHGPLGWMLSSATLDAVVALFSAWANG